MPKPHLALHACAFLAILTGCTAEDAGGSGETPPAGDPPVTSVYVVPASLDELSGPTFFDHPWPSDLRKEGGAVRFEGYPNPRSVPLLDEYIEAMAGAVEGFSPIAAGFARFDGAIDPASLPASPLAATDPGASVQLVDIDPDSPERGQRHLVSLEWHAGSDEAVYWMPNTLAFMPTVGFPLRPHGRYALVATDALLGEDGRPVAPSAELRRVLGLEPPGEGPLAAAHDALAPDLDELEAAGIEREHIVQLAAFSTNDPTAELFAIRDDLLESVAAPTMDDTAWQVADSTADFDEYQGRFGPLPRYQAGTIPFEKYGDGGEFVFDGGKPQTFGEFDLRFSLTVPKSSACPMPAAGYPIVLYAHGTGGSWRSHLNVAVDLAQRCIASMGVDQIFHGDYPGAPADGSEAKISILFFNFENIVAARTNTRQSALDEVQRARLFTETAATVPASVSTTGADVLFDPDRVMFYGHSQGGLNGPLYLAADDSSLGGVLSGSSSIISITLLEKTKPEPSIAKLVEILLSLGPAEAAELGMMHPAISLAQSIVDVVDPIHYARFAATSPRAGFAPKSIYMTEGINPDGSGDSYSPPHGIEAHAIAMGLPLQLPAVRDIVESAWGGPEPVTIPAGGLSGNLAAGAASGVLAQWAVPEGSDGHFVATKVPAARSQAADFLRNLADDPKGLVPEP